MGEGHSSYLVKFYLEEGEEDLRMEGFSSNLTQLEKRGGVREEPRLEKDLTRDRRGLRERPEPLEATSTIACWDLRVALK